jgi:hypothetical protein
MIYLCAHGELMVAAREPHLRCHSAPEARTKIRGPASYQPPFFILFLNIAAIMLHECSPTGLKNTN